VKRRGEDGRILRELLETTRELRAYWRLRPGEVYRAKQRLRKLRLRVPLPDRDVGGAAFPGDLDLDTAVDTPAELTRHAVAAARRGETTRVGIDEL